MKTMETKRTKHISRRFRRFLWANKAVSALEYALVIGLVATGIAAALLLFGDQLKGTITAMGAKVTAAKTAAEADN